MTPTARRFTPRLAFPLLVAFLTALVLQSAPAAAAPKPKPSTTTTTASPSTTTTAPVDCEAVRCSLQPQFDSQCPCSSFTSHSAYVACIHNVIVASGFAKQCNSAILNCMAASTCGQSAGYVTCNEPEGGCEVEKSASACTSEGGTVRSSTNCCPSCATTTTTSTTTSTSTSTTSTSTSTSSTTSTTQACAAGETLCSGMCTNTNTDPNNCGSCGTVCASTDTCVGGVCTPKTVASSCLPTSSLSTLIQGSNVTAYVPLGSWTEGTPGVKVVPLEPAPGASTTVATTGPVNSCSSDNVTGTTVCTGNVNDVYVINGTTLSSTPTATATAFQSFSGGTCETCGVAFDAATGLAWIAEGDSSSVGALEPLTPPSTFGTKIGLFGLQTSENVSVDPVRHLILSAVETFSGPGQFQIINTMTGAVYNSAVTFSASGLGELDSTAEDCSTGIGLAPIEFTESVVLVNLSGAIFTSGSPGTWSAPTNIQDFSPDFGNLSAGDSGSAVAPGSHLAIIAGEFGGAGFGVLQLQTAVTATTTPAATDWVSANVPNDPSGVPWSMGLDPHTVTAYLSPNDGKAYGLMTNDTRTFLVKVDLALLLSAPRIAATHTADPALIPAGTFTFIAE